MTRALAMVALAVTAVALATARPAAAEPPVVIATQPLALLGRGLGGSYERPLSRDLSAVALAGVRGAARGDYESRTWAVAGELRYWPLSSSSRRLLVAVHAGAAHTSLTDLVMDTHVGSAWALTQRLDVGWRWVVWDHLTITPTLGVVVREDVDRTGRLATTARPTIAFGFEVGWAM